MKKRIIGAVLSAVLAFSALSPSVQTALGNAYISAEAAEALAVPTASLKSATYALSGSGMKVTLSHADKSAQIYYSLNGAQYRLYQSAINITRNSSLRTYAKKGGNTSSIQTYTYQLTPVIRLSVAGGTYSSPRTVYLSSTVPGVRYYYTLDGRTPTAKSSLYTSRGIQISKSCTLKVLAVKGNWTSKSESVQYTITSDSSSSVSSSSVTSSASSAAVSSDGLLSDYTKKWAYNTLNSAQKQAYARTYKSAQEHSASFSIADLKLRDEDYRKAYWAFDFDNPQFLALGSGYNYTYAVDTGYITEVRILYGRSAAQVKSIQGNFNSAMQSALNEAKKLSSDYSKVKYFHDWIINRTSYHTTGGKYISEADGPAIYKEALCEGYSKAFMYLCQAAGIDCICVAGVSGGGGHMWNMVKLDGAWYHVDVTWDDPVSSRPILRHDYFLVSDAQIKKDHTFDNYFTLPKALRNYTR